MERLLKKFQTAADAGAAARRCARPRSRRASASIYFGSTSPAMAEALDALRGRGHPPRRAAPARVPVPRRGRASSSPRTTRSSWSSRTATPRCARCWSTSSTSTRRGSCRVLHYDGTPITARFIVEAIAAAACAPHNVEPIAKNEGARGMTYLAKPKLHHPTLPANKVGYTRRDYEGRDLHAVRRLRPRLDLGGASCRPAGSSTSSRTASPSSRASAAARRRPTTSSAPRTASTPCTAACRRC